MIGMICSNVMFLLVFVIVVWKLMFNWIWFCVFFWKDVLIFCVKFFIWLIWFFVVYFVVNFVIFGFNKYFSLNKFCIIWFWFLIKEKLSGLLVIFCLLLMNVFVFCWILRIFLEVSVWIVFCIVLCFIFK